MTDNDYYIVLHNKGIWDKKEDVRLIKAVNNMTNIKWSCVSKLVQTRSGKQCRERWKNRLNPITKHIIWSKSETSKLIRLHEMYGNKWSILSRNLKNRSPYSIKTRWSVLTKHKTNEIVYANNIEPFQSHEEGEEGKEGKEGKEIYENNIEPLQPHERTDDYDVWEEIIECLTT